MPVSSGEKRRGWADGAEEVSVAVKILALITARGGSKRLPHKNIRSLGGRPLIVWSIDVARGMPEICDILVSTDDEAIADIARSAGAMVPWLRPDELATDLASSVDACRHALDWYEGENGKVDGLLLLQPTSPFRSRDSVMRGIELFRSHQRRPVLGVSPAASHPMWCFRVDGADMRPFVDSVGLQLRSQDLPAAYVVNGAFYLIAPADLRARHAFYGDDAVALKIEAPEESLDIDTEWDWRLAESIVAGGGGVQ
jgi:CMP-N,N'-diacetyllegionaminic acid synthase